MADQITFQPLRALDQNGNPVAGAVASFYASGTTIPVIVYSNQAMTLPHTNPLTADGFGIFPPVYIGSGAVRIVVSSPTGVVLPGYPMDPAPQHTVNANTAEMVSFVPAEGVAATNVQAAIEAIQANVTGEAARVDELLDGKVLTNFTPVEQGGAAGTGNQKIRIGWGASDNGLRVEVDGVVIGRLLFTTNVAGPARSGQFIASGNAGMYACRAWGKIAGSSSPSMLASGGVTDVTRIEGGVYRINFSTAMPHANYAVCTTAANEGYFVAITDQLAGSFTASVQTRTDGGGHPEPASFYFSVFC
ncbi:hypothetical protein [Haematobacter sp. UBA3484]|uniref:hypothetical protein n=1 Tax=Haematobacter sp. UBA3484 TaxID=1946582 RepID=UPI0025C2AD7B|nr:hypothetical protein [Haematobacter sp. UBA3484]